MERDFHYKIVENVKIYNWYNELSKLENRMMIITKNEIEKI